MVDIIALHLLKLRIECELWKKLLVLWASYEILLMLVAMR